MKIPLLRLEYSDEDISVIKDEIEKVLKSGFLTMDQKVREFEEAFAGFCQTKYAVGTNSGTSSLEIILRCLDVAGGTVLMPSNTYMATALASMKAGAKVKFVDCRRETLQISADDLKEKMDGDTKAVIIVHIGGIISPEFETIKKVCDDKNIPLIEDAAHAHGATYKGTPAGKLGLAGSFSFYPTKVMTCAEGGMMTTDNKDIYKKALVLREHGKTDHAFNIHSEIGDNWRFSEIHAVLGLQQMKRADYILSERRRLAALYDELLEDVPSLKKVVIPDEINSAYYKYIAFLPDGMKRSDLKKQLLDDYQIELPGEVYSDPCHSQPVFKKHPEYLANSSDDQFPNTDYVCSQQICLPLYPGLKDEEAQYIVQSLKKVFSCPTNQASLSKAANS